MVVVELAKAKKEKEHGKKDSSVYASGFHTIGGFIAGFAMVELWKALKIPHMDEKLTHSLINHHPIENCHTCTVDKMVAITISSALMLSELVGNKGGLPAGTGFLLGYTTATDFRKNKYIGHLN